MTTREKPLVVGVTGGIGSGKSTVARMLAETSGTVVDADRIAHEALRQPALRDRVVFLFGPGVVRADGEIDRKALGSIVFGAAAKRVALEAIVLPWIRERILQELKEARERTDCRVVVLDAPLLIEGGWTDHVDVMIHVNASFSERLARVRDRGWDESELNRRESVQLPLTNKQAMADHEVNNSGGFESLRSQVQAIVKELGLESSANQPPG